MSYAGLSKKAYYQLTREERADLIEDWQVHIGGARSWQVDGTRGGHLDVYLHRERCIRRRCAGMEPCPHLYSCGCPDEVNPCKHIIKVHKMLLSGAHFDCESSLSVEERAEIAAPTPPAFTPEERQELLAADVAKISASLEGIRALLQDPRFSIDVSSDLECHLRRALDETEKEMQRPVRF